MLWVVKRRWWILAGGLVLFLLGLVLSGPRTDVGIGSVFGGVGLVMVVWATLAALLAIPMALEPAVRLLDLPIQTDPPSGGSLDLT